MSDLDINKNSSATGLREKTGTGVGGVGSGYDNTSTTGTAGYGTTERTSGTGYGTSGTGMTGTGMTGTTGDVSQVILHTVLFSLHCYIVSALWSHDLHKGC